MLENCPHCIPAPWLAGWLADISSHLLCRVDQVAGSLMMQVYGQQFLKVLHALAGPYMTKLEQATKESGNTTDAVKLVSLKEDCAAWLKGQFNEPAGRDIPA